MTDFGFKLAGVPIFLFVSVVTIGLAGCAANEPAPAPSPPVAIVETPAISLPQMNRPRMISPTGSKQSFSAFQTASALRPAPDIRTRKFRS